MTQGPKIGQIALKFGANDYGSVMMEENVVSAAGTKFRLTVGEITKAITELGYEARQRDNWYRLAGGSDSVLTHLPQAGFLQVGPLNFDGITQFRN